MNRNEHSIDGIKKPFSIEEVTSVWAAYSCSTLSQKDVSEISKVGLSRTRLILKHIDSFPAEWKTMGFNKAGDMMETVANNTKHLRQGLFL